MTYSLADIKKDFDYGVAQGYTHMIIMCDTYDYEDFPIYVSAGENPHTVADNEKRLTPMSQIMECYKLDIDWELQSKEARANHWEF